ncbi:probable transcriptional regulatory protein Nhal_0175 [Candidatus Rickettsiella viridis]|uniref:Probable transcriptional regulatory protein RVIR1_08070 n=1 Tax=Candidatus Rickettsiella viridis TaxID=676208 RepID=A0A2Z5UUG9_9COXI|nr:YebC/PmpR family DNA-binding transcriptional regulator [Candidatus Rickettsiella viridis]BBB15296.1 probable transcriptional regulatory protein Nhal_0175 [Candidatus Rickettsiella viridis]
MAGHSKWANIQHRKNAQDAKRGKLFTKLIREITVAARMGGGELSKNPRLRLAVDKALSANMSKDTIERATKKGAGGLEGAQMEEIRYEGYGPKGVAVLVDVLTDNRNRTVAEVRHAFTKCGGNLGTSGSVAYLFNKKGVITFEPGAEEEKILELALEAGADDVVTYPDKSIDVFSSETLLPQLKALFEEKKLMPVNSEVTWLAATHVALSGDDAEKMERLTSMLEDLDDVQMVYSNQE